MKILLIIFFMYIVPAFVVRYIWFYCDQDEDKYIRLKRTPQIIWGEMSSHDRSAFLTITFTPFLNFISFIIFLIYTPILYIVYRINNISISNKISSNKFIKWFLNDV